MSRLQIVIDNLSTNKGTTACTAVSLMGDQPNHIIDRINTNVFPVCCLTLCNRCPIHYSNMSQSEIIKDLL